MTESTRRQKMERIAQAMFEHGSVQKAAAALGMSEVTVWRWTQKPEFQEAYSEVRREALSRSSGRLLHGSGAAAATLLKLMLDPSAPAAVRVRAAEGVLEHAEKTFELEEVDVRLKRLEQATHQK
jgi:DNA-binding MurR/RpiR family transcriptional regulator